MVPIDLLLLVASLAVLVVAAVLLARVKAEKTDNSRLLDEKVSLEQQRNRALEDVRRLVEARAQGESELKERYDSYERLLKDDYKRKMADLDANYETTANEVREHMDELQRQLQSMKSTRDAAILAAKREREVADSPQVYTLSLSPQEESDVSFLESVLPRLFFPEVLGKYIWSCYYQKKYKTLAANVLGTDPVCGVYKITDQLTGEAYIGQSKNVAKRWGDHMRAGCGATSSSKTNRLYEAMRRDGLSHFSFELLEACDADDLDEKEKFFIELYSSDSLGLNSTAGNENENRIK